MNNEDNIYAQGAPNSFIRSVQRSPEIASRLCRGLEAMQKRVYLFATFDRNGEPINEAGTIFDDAARLLARAEWPGATWRKLYLPSGSFKVEVEK